MHMSLKNDLLFALESNRYADLSGQMLADQLGVSRNAIWKAINSLKQDGYEILSGTNKGYRLADGSDLLSAEGIRQSLSGAARKLAVSFFKEIDSTNDEAKRMLANGLKESALIVAESQSQGHGRNGRSFYSPSRTGIYMTVILHPEASLADAVSITTVAAVAVARAIERLTAQKPLIKWVNDIYLGGKKICGILTEAVTDFESGTVHSVIVGIGVNIRTVDFPQPIRDFAASLEPVDVTRNRIAAEIANQLLLLTQSLSDKSYLDDYRAHSMVIGKKINCYQGNSVFPATAIGIDDDGGLIIQHEDGSKQVLHSGEISIRLA